ncbi:hypothetical protein E2P84_27430 [Burkholderia cepacia]|uniref:DUF4102 domain-containing protein n=1 Tax=Burkholderia cepacia TaxID=292 RepID=A0AAX2RW07_BURCE|nr:hypothetical protein [Burkholderia cepacia]TES71456.1 hypothetical protein E2P84_27430 [Burkholderia cepacia]TES97915.1 hypothetical protein E3D36_30345 [Burkholderia cepacia]TEU34459.1 hypothetical protein E3D39_31005 [Burkholderia cepacia]TEU43212.1 hypothetical protein E3D38_30155 [Burkholderia cepacia]TEU52137.1 hypothetical protein E3D37_05595 [Burkholderia cepacia]
MSDLIQAAIVGSRIYFEGERMPYTVQARDGRFLVCVKPFAARHTYIYSIVDLKRGERGPDNMIFGRSGGYGSRVDCEEALRDLADPANPLEVSRRNCVPLKISKIKVAA